jgi:hypothetical protein
MVPLSDVVANLAESWNDQKAQKSSKIDILPRSKALYIIETKHCIKL